MLKNATGFRHIYLRCGYTDLRRGIDGLAMTIKGELGLDPYEHGSIYLLEYIDELMPWSESLPDKCRREAKN